MASGHKTAAARRVAPLIGAAAALVLAALPASADPNDNELVIDGETLVTKTAAPAELDLPMDNIYSGWRFRSPETQALQSDDFENPGFPMVEQAEGLWSTADGSEGKSCASCHNDASESMKGVRAEMPKWNEAAGKPMTLEQHINGCRTGRMGAEAWDWESDQMLGMTAYIGLQSRGMPLNPKIDGPMAEWHKKGKDIYYSRVGQLDMACSHCHENYYGKRIRADHLSMGMINGFPTYRFKWQKMGSIHRRFKGCMRNIRAEPYKVGGDEFVALELYVASRGKGLSVETPAVRQ